MGALGRMRGVERGEGDEVLGRQGMLGIGKG